MPQGTVADDHVRLFNGRLVDGEYNKSVRRGSGTRRGTWECEFAAEQAKQLNVDVLCILTDNWTALSLAASLMGLREGCQTVPQHAKRFEKRVLGCGRGWLRSQRCCDPVGAVGRSQSEL